MADVKIKNKRLVPTDWGVEIYLRLKDDVPESNFAQYGASVGHGVTEYLGRGLSAAEAAQLKQLGYVEV